MVDQLVLPEWVCANCGSPGATLLDGFIPLDPRYGKGWCNTCNNPNADRKTPRPTQRLVRGDSFDRARWEERREREELATLVKDFGAIRSGSVKMKDPEILRLVTLFDKYGFAGFRLPEDARKAADEYQATEARRAEAVARNKPKRGRGA